MILVIECFLNSLDIYILRYYLKLFEYIYIYIYIYFIFLFVWYCFCVSHRYLVVPSFVANEHSQVWIMTLQTCTFWYHHIPSVYFWRRPADSWAKFASKAPVQSPNSFAHRLHVEFGPLTRTGQIRTSRATQANRNNARWHSWTNKKKRSVCTVGDGFARTWCMCLGIVMDNQLQ